MNFYPVSFSFICNEHEIVMCRSNKQLIDIVFFHQFCTDSSFSSTTLTFVQADRNTLDVSQFGDKDNHILFFYHVFYIDFFYFTGNNICFTIIAIFFCNLICFLFNNLKDFFVMGKQVFKVGNKGFNLCHFLL